MKSIKRWPVRSGDPQNSFRFFPILLGFIIVAASIVVGTIATVETGVEASPAPTAIQTPTPSPSPTPNATPSPTPNASPTPTPNPSPNPSPSPNPTPIPSPTPGGEIRLRARLAGASINGMTPTAEVEFRVEGNDRRFEVEVENVNLPAGTRINVLVDNAVAGTIVLNNQFEGELRLRTDNGQAVPQVTSRSQIVIATQSGMTIVAGTFSPSPLPSPTPNATPAPSPSPTPNPSPSPSPNPTPSPSPSPNPSPFRQAKRGFKRVLRAWQSTI